MYKGLSETIANNKIILIITEADIFKDLGEQLFKDLSCKTIWFDSFDSKPIENLLVNEKYYFILCGLAEDGRFENIFSRYKLDIYQRD